MNVFDNAADPLETLVGDGKKYQSPAELAKAYIHADATIKAREEELATMRQELQTRLTVEEQLRKAREDSNRATGNPAQDPPKTPQAISEEDLNARILEVTNRASREARARQNAEEVAAKLVELYGDTAKANEVVRRRAADLGVSVEFLRDAAAQSPKAFYAQLGLDTSANTSNQRVAPPSRSEVNLNGNTSMVKEGSYEFYEQIRKDRPKEYFSIKIQNQLMKDAMEGRYIPPER